MPKKLLKVMPFIVALPPLYSVFVAFNSGLVFGSSESAHAPVNCGAPSSVYASFRIAVVVGVYDITKGAVASSGNATVYSVVFALNVNGLPS